MISRKSSASSKPTASRGPVPDGPFAPDIERRARAIAEAYRLVLEPEKGGFLGRALEFPTAFEHGATADECVRNTRVALTVAVATMLELNQRPPTPAARGTRPAQVNVRLSAEEKLLLEETARREGFRGVSDYVRALVVARASEDVIERSPSPGFRRRPTRKQ